MDKATLLLECHHDNGIDTVHCDYKPYLVLNSSSASQVRIDGQSENNTIYLLLLYTVSSLINDGSSDEYISTNINSIRFITFMSM